MVVSWRDALIGGGMTKPESIEEGAENDQPPARLFQNSLVRHFELVA
jgi:hypothetical protein